MSKKMHICTQALGLVTIFTDRGVPLVFKEGVHILVEGEVAEETLYWLEKEGKANGVRPMSDEEVKAYEDELAKQAKALERKLNAQALADGIIKGVDPVLIPAQVAASAAAINPAPSNVQANSVQAKLAEARAAAAGKR